LELPFTHFSKDTEERKLPSRLPENSSVLVVEDNPLAGECLSGLLRRLGLTPFVADSGALAIKMLRQDPEKFSLLIVDQEMPHMTGLDTIEALFGAGLPPGTPVMLTRNVVSQKEDIDPQVHGKSVFVLQKPISILSLYSALCEIFGDGQEKTEEESNTTFDYEVLNNKKVLVVDDNQFNREVLDVILSQVKIFPVTVSSGFEAIEILKTDKSFDVVLMDVEMPEMDGLTATKIIRNELELVDLPIIALTAKVIRGDRDVCLESGMNDYLSKPIDTQALFNKLKIWIGR
jgi:two-component system sensor histidine kinase/response regulator